MSARLSLVRGVTVAFAGAFVAFALAALAAFPFEAAATPLLPGILLAASMGACARHARRSTRLQREELTELARANLGLFGMTFVLVAGEVSLGWSHAPLVLATGALSAVAVLHAALTLVALHLRPRSLPACAPLASHGSDGHWRTG